MSSAVLVPMSRSVLQKHARSFHLASRFLPADRRDAAAVLYAFCRLVDDTADEAPDPVVADRELNQLRRELQGASEPTPLVREVARILEGGHAGVRPGLHLIDGVQSDLGEVLLASDAELLRYAYRVAGTVGEMMCAALGVTDPSAIPFAVDLGLGMQLTNICRDVLEDAGRGRVYLPQSRLLAAGTSQQEVLDGTADREAVAAVVLDLLELADRYYASADAGLRFIPVRSRVAIAVASRVYRAIGEVLRARGGDALRGRVSTSPWVKGIAVVRALGAALWLSLPADPTHEPDLHGDLDGLVLGRAG